VLELATPEWVMGSSKKGGSGGGRTKEKKKRKQGCQRKLLAKGILGPLGTSRKGTLAGRSVRWDKGEKKGNKCPLKEIRKNCKLWVRGGGEKVSLIIIGRVGMCLSHKYNEEENSEREGGKNAYRLAEWIQDVRIIGVPLT